MQYLFVILTLTVFLYSDLALAWGERGHNLISRVAATLVYERVETNSQALPFHTRKLMLGHLANVPDIVWRSESVSASVRKENSPTHYVNLDLITKNISVYGIPRNFVEAKNATMKTSGKNLSTEAGTALWRLEQLFIDAQEGFAAAKAAKAKHPQFIQRVDQALLACGLLAHFVGDLANPEHTSSDYDGWEKAQGGLHSYFETNVIDTYPLNLDFEVYQAVQASRPFKNKILPQLKTPKDQKDAFLIGVALAVDSFKNLSDLEALDLEAAVLVKSTRNGAAKIAAKRRAADEVKAKFKPFVIDRLAIAADTLAELWILALRKAGSPSLANYHSYEYPVSPEFIQPDYQ